MQRRAVKNLTFALATLLASSLAHADDLLQRVQQKKQITIATEARFAPFESVENGKIVGYGADLMTYVLKDLPEVKVKQLDLPFQGILPGLDTGKFDFVVTSVTVNKARFEQFAFTVPIAESTVALLKRGNDDSISSLNDLNGKVVGSQSGSGQLQVLQAYDQKLKDAGQPGLKAIREYVSFDEAYADLALGRLDGVAQSLSNLGPLIKSRPGVFSTLSDMLGPQTYYGWVGRKDADSASLVKLFSDGIARANRDGTMKALQEKWFGFTMDVPADAMPEPSI
ncbi:TPA: transporter substrate-binding domain-containing protein [Pseudomonas aeruginosa]|jgi:polar amino acid transport system substrate-binding protein|uniref:Transporter substrate-binding domain-containing protein n=1 Tax=Stutzerimonas marianensis TaxID=2929513 RepID=A0A9X1W4R5_9GAMM|nr:MULTISPECIES: transporter substrate-binding domain-containing protein [Pseudomonadaceae]MAG66124.1 ABC transporter substrate-binding protein [Pseudomonadales bacterium]MAK87100.1 ABC transporter substrate-binding protein [Pseudomonas sp.]EJD6522692.1 transporter substrate-binding domain-containing protein [Pseudomonas aeruginosa]EKT8215761.1 transporter substrate-binding domain-containing protein [Pseudomonas aeruginosa]EKU0601218.1 transporter substrate-binding domain-containing protein [P|tara:strand:- start:271 stop:1116 length:846 start_codon:yes stop_codon:yes gene_type:complete